VNHGELCYRWRAVDGRPPGRVVISTILSRIWASVLGVAVTLEYVTGVGDDTFPDAALTSGAAGSNQVLVRSEANPQLNGRVYRIAYTVSDGQGGSCSGTARPNGATTAKVGGPRKKGTPAIDNGGATRWDSFTGVPTS
jgi:hypothetical protein